MTFTIRRRSLLIAAAVAVLGIGGAFAYASIPDSNGVIHACYHVGGQGTVDASATLRVIDPNSSNKDGRMCKKDEVALDFNQMGPPGKNGSNGTNGTNGLNGMNGTNGVSGYEIIEDAGPLPAGVDGNPGTGQIRQANCPSGKKAIGGGVLVDANVAFTDSIVRWSGPTSDGSGWSVHIQRTDDGPPEVTTVRVRVICASVS